MRRILKAVLLGSLAMLPASRAVGQDWAKAMFSHTSHDFGMVARGANAEHRFPLENIYLEDVHIRSITSTCACTTVRVTQPLLKTYEKAEIVATLNTRQFTGRKDATIRVVFDQPFPAEVQLHCYSYIRTDVVLEPGEVAFGQVSEGTAIEKTVNLSHAGSPDWKIVGFKVDDPHLGVVIEPLSQTGTQTNYRLRFQLKPSAPPGYIRRHVTLLTNDRRPEAQQLLVPVEGVVMPAVSIRPSPLGLGPVRAGTSMTRNVVVQGQKPFQILELTGPDERFSFGPAAGRGTSASLHLVPVTFASGMAPGKIDGQILIRTDIGGGRTLALEVTGEVLDESGGATPQVGSEAAPAEGWRSAGP